MNRRGKRLTLGMMGVGLVVVLVLVVAYRRPILDHVEAWHFQLTRETVRIEPDPAAVKRRIQGDLSIFDADTRGFFAPLEYLLPLLGSSETAVIFEQGSKAAVWWDRALTPHSPVDLTTPDVARRILALNGYRVLEQRFPRRAYVLIRDEHYYEEDHGPIELDPKNLPVTR